MPNPELPLEERLALLEAHIEVQEELLTAMQAERIEAERLNDSIVRLGLGATSLGEALLTVDRQQQLLTRLGREVAEATQKVDVLDSKTVSKEELEERERIAEEERARRETEIEENRKRRERQLRELRRRRQQQVVAWSVLGSATVVALLLGLTVSNAADERAEARFQRSVYDICLARADQARKIRNIIQRQPPETPEDAKERELLLSAFPVIPCEGLLE